MDEDKEEVDNPVECAFPKPAFFDLSPIKGGLLFKQSTNLVGSWKPHLFLLDGKHVFYFDSVQDKVPRGAFHIGDCKIEDLPDLARERRMYCFSVTTKSGWNFHQNKAFVNRVYVFSTPSFQEMSDWMCILNAMGQLQEDALLLT